MKITKFAAVIARLVGLQNVVAALLYLTYLPERALAASTALTEAHAEYIHLEIRMLWIRFGIHVLAGAAFYLFANQIAKTVATGLDEGYASGSNV
jgi:hypothetical protein